MQQRNTYIQPTEMNSGREFIETDNTNSTIKLELVKSGDDFFLRAKELFLNAQSEIHLQTYIFENDSVGKEIAAALKDAALRNVKVFVLLDGYGSLALSKQFVNDLKQVGINIRFFSPFHSSNNLYIGRRLHHKVIVVDGKKILIGGINMAEKYRGTQNKVPWLDYAVQFENEMVGQNLQQLCRNIYFKKKKRHITKLKLFNPISNGSELRILINDWLKRKNEIRNAYMKAIKKSNSEIFIVSSYFLPGRRILHALNKASRRGVKINLILSGITDVPILKSATSYLYKSLLKSNIRIFEWDQSVLHGKVAVIDNEWTTIGSFNLNHLSYYGSIEMNAEIYSSDFSSMLVDELNQIISKSKNITFQLVSTRFGIITNILNWIAYSLVRISLVIATYIPYKRLPKLY